MKKLRQGFAGLEIVVFFGVAALVTVAIKAMS